MIANMEGGPESNAARQNKKKTMLERLNKFRVAVQRGMSLPESADFEVQLFGRILYVELIVH